MIFILNRHCLLYGLQSKKQLAEILHITDKKLLKGKTQDEINIYITTDPKERLIEAPSWSIKKSQETIKQDKIEPITIEGFNIHVAGF